eukprot:3249354-Ditylum_brightwellii.AAC.2
MTDKQGDNLAKTLYHGTLPQMGISASFPKVMRYVPSSHFGLNLPQPHQDMDISKIQFWICFYDTCTVPGHFLRTSYEQLVLELGFPAHIFSLDFSQFGSLATD